MSQKQNKKLRQFYKRDVRDLVVERVNLMTKHVLNNKPKWMPKFVWRKLVRLVIKV